MPVRTLSHQISAFDKINTPNVDRPVPVVGIRAALLFEERMGKGTPILQPDT